MLIHVFPAQARAAGTFVSGSANYSGGLVNCMLQLVDANWTTDPTTLVVKIFGEESFDSGTTWLNTIGPYSWSPPALGKGGSLPSASFTAGNDGGGARLVRATLTLSDSVNTGNIWSGGVDLTVA